MFGKFIKKNYIFVNLQFVGGAVMFSHYDRLSLAHVYLTIYTFRGYDITYFRFG